MLKSLRWRLTLLYLAAAIGMLALLSGGTYLLITQYFQRTVDMALEYKMALEFRQRGLALPAGLVEAEQAWLASNPRAVPATPTPVPVSMDEHEAGESEEEEQSEHSSATGQEAGADDDDRYNGNLAPVFVVPETDTPTIPSIPAEANMAAMTGALQRGSDLRTVRLESGARVRLLTWRTGLTSPVVLQVGRLLTDQDRLLSRTLLGLLGLGGAAALFLAVTSWWLAGRSILPAQRAWDQQQQFVSNASHELRTPLTILRASADYGLRSGSAAERETALRDVLDECDYMNRLVEDLLLLSRLDAHRLVLAHVAVPVPALLADVVRDVEKLAREKDVSVVLEPAAGVVRADPLRLRQVLLILFDNALRFTPSGGTIRFGAEIHGKWVTLYVGDSGAGIPAKDLPHVFERFYQVPGATGDGRGNGLGLSIAKSLIEAQHGKLAIKSEAGRGTVVAIHLPGESKVS
jgi:signal transduction histidine kinase